MTSSVVLKHSATRGAAILAAVAAIAAPAAFTEEKLRELKQPTQHHRTPTNQTTKTINTNTSEPTVKPETPKPTKQTKTPKQIIDDKTKHDQAKIANPHKQWPTIHTPHLHDHQPKPIRGF